MNYDVIGDVHGQAERLTTLLAKMGYVETNKCWAKDGHQALFVGDFIDRGPQQWDVCEIVMRMVKGNAAQAIMGNHEFNGIAWFLEDPACSGEYLRKHTQNNRHQHQDFLTEVEGNDKHRALIEWFLTLPLWLDLDGLRVIHACWHPAYMAEIALVLSAERKLNKSAMVAASSPHTMEFRTVEGLLKGLEVALPDGLGFHDKSGHYRTKVRVRWWDKNATTYKTAALVGNDILSQLPDTELPSDCRIGYEDTKPLFFGHYSMPGLPAVLTPHVACVDFYDKEDDRLVAYQWTGESVLSNDKFIYA